MFASGSFHPASINYTRKASTMSRKDRSSSSGSSSSAGTPKYNKSSSIGIELALLAALQGSEMSYEDRHRIAASIDSLSTEAQVALIAFIQEHDGAAPAAIENNACKLLQCSPGSIGEALASSEPETLMELWTSLYTRIIPALQAMLYPLKKADPSFDVRRVLLAAFRDRVFMRVLHFMDYSVVEWESVLFTLLLETMDGSSEFIDFQRAAQSLVHHDYAKERKTRQPRKSVHFVDVRQSAPILM